jgi:hypothetical protein
MGQGRGMPGTTKQDHQAERLQAIRLRYSINTHLEDCGTTTPASIGAAPDCRPLRRSGC